MNLPLGVGSNNPDAFLAWLVRVRTHGVRPVCDHNLDIVYEPRGPDLDTDVRALIASLYWHLTFPSPVQ
jgi:hypothetical protein